MEGSDASVCVGGGSSPGVLPTLTVTYHRTMHLQSLPSHKRFSSSFSESPSCAISRLFSDLAVPAPAGPSSTHSSSSRAPFSSVCSVLSSLLRARSCVEREVFLNVDVIFLRVYSLLTNLRISFNPSTYPAAQALGDLPAAFYNDGVLDSHHLQLLFQAERDLDALGSSSEAPLSTRLTRLQADSAALSAFIDLKLSEVLDFTLWCSEPCYAKFTSQVYRHSLPSVYASPYLYRRRRNAMTRFQGTDNVQILRNLVEILERLDLDSEPEQEDSSIPPGAPGTAPAGRESATPPAPLLRPRFLLCDRPTKADVKLYAYLSVLFQIPSEYTPWYGASACGFIPNAKHSKTGAAARTGCGSGKGSISFFHQAEPSDENGNVSTSPSSPVDELSCLEKGVGCSEAASPEPLLKDLTRPSASESKDGQSRAKASLVLHASLTTPVVSQSPFLRVLQHEQEILSRLAVLLPAARRYLRMFDDFLAAKSAAASGGQARAPRAGAPRVPGRQSGSSASAPQGPGADSFALPPAKAVYACPAARNREILEEGDSLALYGKAHDERERAALKWNTFPTLVAAAATAGLVYLCTQSRA
ncbi:hypothetical protein BESB_050130 [Besnoitia besnoiti]|uniref:Mitochondrial outer membrane transport complex Sam37/metaxin N-terminal domain-containing protein n=1 Tax=Besnoitia besnoiti TaxID=94643 RepID=A0A2A9MKK6_BESBE|nr:hypothetical protein BESB_050130 [Besnoitia besnoiti]PFH36821.1 hypothetical protein BESB_050130 [Besnoitia besnoiti]